jgi:hypothetical protein
LGSYDNYVISQLPIAKKNLPPVSGKISEIGVLGDMVILFDQEMQIKDLNKHLSHMNSKVRYLAESNLTESNRTAFNASMIQASLLPHDDWPGKISNFPKEKLGF